RDMWEKVVLNLLSNAFKYTLSGTIRLRLSAVGDSAELTVEDTGAGIPQAELPRIFERFHRVSRAQGRTQEGSGIGLALIQELVKLHGGSITVESRLGEGSTFRVVLPFGSEHRASQYVPSSSPQSSITADAFLQEALRWLPDGASTPDEDARNRRSERIVLADDNADMREYVTHILAPQFNVEAVSDGQQALETVQRERPDLVLTDIMMPRLDGIGLLKSLRSNPATASIPVVLLTARTEEESVVEGMQAGADDYLMKPFSARELVARVAGHLATAKARREAADALRQSQEQLADRVHDFDVLLRELPVGIAVSMDSECRNIRVNPAFASMLGIDDRQNASKSGPGEAALPFRIVQNGIELRPDQLPMQLAAREGRAIRDFEADIVRKDGSVVRELSHAVPLFDERGAVRGSLAVFVDITERRRAEEVLRESEERFRNMAENAPVMIWVTDLLGDCVYINLRWREFTGTTLEQNLKLGWMERVHPDERPKIKEVLIQANSSRQPFRVEYQLLRKDGQWRWMVDSGTPRFAEDGSFLGYIGSVIDITERKEMESALRASEEQLALAQTAAGVGSWNFDTETGLPSFSGEYHALHGLPKNHPWVSYEEWLSRVHPDDRERVAEANRRAYRETRSLDIEFRVLHPDGTTRWLAGKGTVFSDEAGNPKRFIGINYDITERKLAEHELLKSNEDLKQFAFAASHDLQEPLRVVVNYTQLLERRYKDQLDERAAKIIDTAVGSALRMERLLKGLRDYWHVSDRQSIQITSVDLDDALQKALMNLEDAMQESQATVIHTPLPVVTASETPMIQVFQNLLGNSMKYRSPERPLKIEVGCESRPSEYVISVADNGIGIQPEYASQVFGIFKRLHGQEYAGAGIGLSICQKIIERLGGRIWVEPQELGSLFRFSIPMRLARTNW
ncbi:MAG TPA: ATP-binding protein, partial [Bryobacteraceae bacterium]|nr:ATP-binding protein [Bryobacteraceae bacterium]